MSERTQRRLAAIVAADVAGYSRLVGMDEEGTLEALRSHRRELINDLVDAHGGRIANTAGDSLLLEFPSVVDAVRCTLAVQQGMAARNADLEPDRQIHFRIGINVGDVIAEGDDLLGDGVNIAARVESLADAGGIAISDDAYRQVRDRLDIDWQDGGEHEVKNIARPIRVWRWSQTASEASPVQVSEPLSLPDKPSIAVLPFDNMSGDPEQEYFADGITEDLITALSQLRWLFVIARNSSYSYKGTSPDVRTVAKELGVRYVLEGSVRRAGERVRVTAQLVDATRGNHIWAERFDARLDDIFELQDEITAKIVSAIGPEMTLAEIERRRDQKPTTFNVWDTYLRALPHFHAVTKADFDEAVALLNVCIEYDPKYSNAYALLGHLYATASHHGWLGRVRDSVETSRRYAQEAIRLDPLNAFGHAAHGMSYHVKGPMEESAAAFRRAVELEPNNAMYQSRLGSALGFAGHPEEALEAIEKAERGSPRDPDRWHTMLAKASAQFAAGRLEESLMHAKQATRMQPNHYGGFSFAAASAALLGHQAEAKAAADGLLNLIPHFSIAGVIRNPMFERPEDAQRIVEGLRLAGIPEK